MIKPGSSLLLFLALCFLSGCQGDKPAIRVPHGDPPVIDGRMEPVEWEGAVVEKFLDGSELFLLYSDGYLYLGIRSSTPEMIVGNVFIEREGEIAILHSFAALGTAVYEQGNGAWQRSRDFAWRCRETDNSPEAVERRVAFLGEEHWVAANARMGTPNELEYRIEMADDTLRLAVSFIRASQPEVKIPWPIGLDDDCIKLAAGGLPPQLHFERDKWGTIVVPSS